MKKKIGFYSNNSFKEFSNFYPAPFVIEGLGFSCVEQYMMYKKAELFDDKDKSVNSCVKIAYINARKENYNEYSNISDPLSQ